jgi:hypothetical protein
MGAAKAGIERQVTRMSSKPFKIVSVILLFIER